MDTHAHSVLLMTPSPAQTLEHSYEGARRVQVGEKGGGEGLFFQNSKKKKQGERRSGLSWSFSYVGEDFGMGLQRFPEKVDGWGEEPTNTPSPSVVVSTNRRGKG